MSETNFGLWNGPVSDDWSAAAREIAARHGAWPVVYDDPAEGPRGWFAARNYGEPFDGATRSAVLADLEAAELWTDDRPAEGGAAADIEGEFGLVVAAIMDHATVTEGEDGGFCAVVEPAAAGYPALDTGTRLRDWGDTEAEALYHLASRVSLRVDDVI